MFKPSMVLRYATTAVVALACCLTIWGAPQPKDSPVTESAQTAAQKEQALREQEAKRGNEEKAERIKKKQMAQLYQAKQWSTAGLYDKASTTVSDVLKETDDPDVVKEARAIMEQNVPKAPSWLDKIGLSKATLFTFAAWWVDAVVGIAALYGFLKMVQFLWSKPKRHKWRVGAIAEGTTLGLADVIVQSLSKWSGKTPAVTSGLLKLERLQLSASPRLELPETELDLADALKSVALTFGGVSLSGIANAGKGLRGWLNATRPSINGKAIQSGSELCVILTSRDSKGTTNTVTASVPATATSSLGALIFNLADIKSVAESASYKMFYLISKKESTVIEAEAVNKLREGMNLLSQYIYGQNPGQLETAYLAFRQARTMQADLYEAYLYEGITLDLMLQHDEAIKRFEYLEEKLKETGTKSVETGKNSEVPSVDEEYHRSLRLKATYNKAISLFRKYKYAATKDAAHVLESLIPNNEKLPNTEKLPESKLGSMALAARATVIAQYPKYWQEELCGDRSKDVKEVLGRKLRQGNAAKVESWIKDVQGQTANLTELLARIKVDPSWEESEKQQLAWAIKNALGSVYLNCATYFFAEPYEGDGWKDRRTEFLTHAYDAFQECAMLITPGIEILTNLAKVSLELDRVQQGCNYLQQAIEMNSTYEYAYYRQAKAWEEKGQTAKVLKILKSFPANGNPVIERFIELFCKYDAQLHPA
ncbi:MAG: hypothetical protein JWM21_1881 [Acidobacteria bacterium]|nr:hypothetical protein [Acidobacteriota bacterium]